MGLMSMCSACGSDWCSGCDCVKDEYRARALKLLQKIGERHNGREAMVTLEELKDYERAVKEWR